LVKAKGGTVEEAYAEIERRRQMIEWMYGNEIFDYKEVTDIIHRYYKDPQTLIKEIGLQIKLPVHVELPVLPKKAVKLVVKFGPPTKPEAKARPAEVTEPPITPDTPVARPPIAAVSSMLQETPTKVEEKFREAEEARELATEMEKEAIEAKEAEETERELRPMQPAQSVSAARREKTVRQKGRISTLSLLGFKFIKEK
jgi:hypothetical protein